MGPIDDGNHTQTALPRYCGPVPDTTGWTVPQPAFPLWHKNTWSDLVEWFWQLVGLSMEPTTWIPPRGGVAHTVGPKAPDQCRGPHASLWSGFR